MTKILVMGSEIVAVGPWIETPSVFECENAIIPKSAIPGYQVVDVELPPGFAANGYEWIGGALSEKPRSIEEVDTAKAALKNDVTALRYAKETVGITLQNGAQIKTDRESQATLNGAYTSLKEGLILDTPWKAANGWVPVTFAEIAPIAQAVAVHVRACFAAEKTHCDAIDAITVVNGDVTAALAELSAYDISTGWPD